MPFAVRSCGTGSRASASRPTSSPDLGSVSSSGSSLASERSYSASASERALRRYSSKVGAVCSHPARTVLCGGRRVTAVPTATRVRRRTETGEVPRGQGATTEHVPSFRRTPESSDNAGRDAAHGRSRWIPAFAGMTGNRTEGSAPTPARSSIGRWVI